LPLATNAEHGEGATREALTAARRATRLPLEWRGARLTIGVEAKAKERAVLRLARTLHQL
jgi:hypothetical protein